MKDNINKNPSRNIDYKVSSIRSRGKVILLITIGWVLVALYQFANSYTILKEIGCDFTHIDPQLYFQGSLLTGILAGILGGSAIVFLWEGWLRTKKYSSAVLNIFFSFTIVYLLVGIPSNLFMNSNDLQMSIFESEVWKMVFSDMTGLGSLQNYFFWLLIVIMTTIILQVNDKYGPGVLKDFLLGKYFTPKREERIFMFLDLRSSTAIAEKLGEERYFNFINDVFKFSTSSILQTKGEIYQYVGDEIVISWKMNNGLENANCVNCFLRVQRELKTRSKYFIQQYNVLPEFKAGLHYGHVMAGEIGVVKRDIVFSGDVLNTTARIQSKCNDLGVNILISKYLIDKLQKSIKLINPRKIGDLLLKGKKEKVVLFTV